MIITAMALLLATSQAAPVQTTGSPQPVIACDTPMPDGTLKCVQRASLPTLRTPSPQQQTEPGQSPVANDPGLVVTLRIAVRKDLIGPLCKEWFKKGRRHEAELKRIRAHKPDSLSLDLFQTAVLASGDDYLRDACALAQKTGDVH